MKFFHLSDLHIGKRIHEFSMIEDQAYILDSIIDMIGIHKPDAVILAGDIYDKAVPSAEAVALFDSFLCRLTDCGCSVFMISGNHDSPERIAFGGKLMERSNVYVAPVYSGKVEPITVSDSFGAINIYLLPFVKPTVVRHYAPDAEIESYTDAMRTVIDGLDMDKSARNILVTHQFVTGASRCESEEISVGGSDNVDASVFDDFDYVALGHIHSPQDIGSSKIRYCGTPLKYSFSEANHQKSVTVVELGEKGSLTVRTAPLIPKRDMVEIKGSYEEITLKSFYEGTTYQDDYVHITLTDEEDVVDAIGKLRVIYRNLMKLDYDNKRTRSAARVDGAEDVETKSPLQHFASLYELQNNQVMNDEQKTFVEALIEQIWGGEA